MRKSVMSVVLVCAAVGLLTGQAFSGRSERGEDDIYIAPHTLVLSSVVPCVTVHTNLPISAVDDDATVELGNEDGDLIEATSTFADSRGNLVAKFTIEAVKEIVEPGSVTLDLLVGGKLIGSDTITVRP